jgi:hypothetical protein
MASQQSTIDILEQVLTSASAWLDAFDNEKLGSVGAQTYNSYVGDVSALNDIGIDVSRWTDVPWRVVSLGKEQELIYDFALFGVRVRSLVGFLERRLEREQQTQAAGGAPLTDAQLDLLHDVVMANRNVAATQRQEIIGFSADGQTTFFHPGLPERSLTPNMVDLKRLHQLGLISLDDRGGRKGWNVDVLPAGEAAVDASNLRSTASPFTGHESPPSLPGEYRYHVAVSYAGSDVEFAHDLVALLEQDGYRVFFAPNKQAELWGKDLHSYLQDVFTDESLFCVLFVSDEYKNRIWTNKELQDALGRQIKQRGDEYILPVQLEAGVHLAGLPTSISYVSIDEFPIIQIRDLLVQKIEHRLAK